MLQAKEKRGYLAADASDLTSLTATSPQSSRGTLVQDAASSSTGTLPELSLATAGLTKELLGMGASSIVMLVWVPSNDTTLQSMCTSASAFLVELLSSGMLW